MLCRSKLFLRFIPTASRIFYNRTFSILQSISSTLDIKSNGVPASQLTYNRVSRKFCEKMSDQIVTYEDVVNIKDKPATILIDVRDPQELKETGVLPSSINIPLGELTDVLQNASPEEFKAKYGRNFPNKDTELVFSCKLGGRANKAMDVAVSLGFVNSKFYKGSWTDWSSRQQ